MAKLIQYCKAKYSKNKTLTLCEEEEEKKKVLLCPHVPGGQQERIARDASWVSEHSVCLWAPSKPGFPMGQEKVD